MRCGRMAGQVVEHRDPARRDTATESPCTSVSIFMKQRYKELSHNLCLRAVLECFEKKWHRQDFVAVAEKYGGVSNAEIKRDEAQSAVIKKLEAADGIALELEQRIIDLEDGDPEALDLDPVTERPRIDGISMKCRNVANCCVFHQCFGHLAFLGLEPLLRARILPYQHASIPHRGQSGCRRQVQRFLRRKALGIKYARKLDIRHAYENTKAGVIMGILKKEIPAAKWLLLLVEALLNMSPRGCLIIGGYLDAWLFNLVMSYVLRYMLSLEKVRRGTRQRLVVALVAYADDVAIMGRRLADLRSAARTAAKWTLKTFGLTFKPGGDEVAFLSIEEEHRRRHLTRPAARGCPGLDIVGFVIRRTYTTVRRAIFRRARRQYLRAGREVDKSGTVPLFRAYKLASYYGYFTQTNSRKCSTTLRTEKIKPLACQVIGWATRQKERIHNEKCKHYAGPPAACRCL